VPFDVADLEALADLLKIPMSRFFDPLFRRPDVRTPG